MPTVDVLVADDGSPDGTGKIADEIAAPPTSGCTCCTGRRRTGLGAAYVAGFGWGLERGYDVLVEMDADGSHAPEQLPRLLDALQHADVVLGSRYVAGGTVVNWPKRRELLSRGGNLYSRLALGVRIYDITGGYRAYRAEVLRTLPLAEVASHGYCFQVDLAWRAVQAGFRVTEVPITFTEREIGDLQDERRDRPGGAAEGDRLGRRAPLAPVHRRWSASGAGERTADALSHGPENTKRRPRIGRRW